MHRFHSRSSALGFVLLLAIAQASIAATIYVSKNGDDSDGSSWPKAFRTIQSALNAVPDAGGGHRIVIRPDTYVEANLFAAHKGAADRYNTFIGDADGKLGSGATGWVVIDSSAPAKGFKSYDWYSTFRAYAKGWSKEHTDETFSANVWDRWTFRNIYVTGSDAGLFFDLVDKKEPFTVIVEDCVGIGRAFGGGVASGLSRADEPTTFRRCYLAALDWWGDTAAAYIRVENDKMPDRPDVLLEDCTMVSPQCAFKSSNFGFHTFTHASLDRCRLITLNFSQPQGTPSFGVIQSVEEGKLLRVDLHDCTLMGYKPFGVIVKQQTVNDLAYTVSGDVRGADAVSTGKFLQRNPPPRPPGRLISSNQLPHPRSRPPNHPLSRRKSERYLKKYSSNCCGVPSYSAHCRSPAYC